MQASTFFMCLHGEPQASYTPQIVEHAFSEIFAHSIYCGSYIHHWLLHSCSLYWISLASGFGVMTHVHDESNTSGMRRRVRDFIGRN